MKRYFADLTRIPALCQDEQVLAALHNVTEVRKKNRQAKGYPNTNNNITRVPVAVAKNVVAQQPCITSYIPISTVSIQLEGAIRYPGTRLIFYLGTALRLFWKVKPANESDLGTPNYITKSEDMRINIFLCAPPSSGKGDIIKAARRTALGANLLIKEPSKPHPDQFIGKRVDVFQASGKYAFDPSGSRQFKDNRGHFGKDLIILDECWKYFESQESSYVDIRNMTKKALDAYPFGIIEKDRVDDFHHLSYPSHVSMLTSTQPTPIAEDVITTGCMRRFVPFCLLESPPNVNIYAPQTDIAIPSNPVFTPISDTAKQVLVHSVNRYLRFVNRTYADLPPQVVLYFRNDLFYNAERFTICNLAAGIPEPLALWIALYDLRLFYNSLWNYLIQYIKVPNVPKQIDAQLMKTLYTAFRMMINTGTYTAEDLAQKVGVSERTMRTYLAALKSRGYPL